MKCPNCGELPQGRQVQRTITLSAEIIRERKCPHCGWTWRTVEKIDTDATSSTK